MAANAKRQITPEFEVVEPSEPTLRVASEEDMVHSTASPAREYQARLEAAWEPGPQDTYSLVERVEPYSLRVRMALIVSSSLALWAPIAIAIYFVIR